MNLLFALFALLPIVANASQIELSKLNIQPGTITTSGVSSGAYMALQTAFAFSSYISGAAVVAGGPFGCARGSAEIAKDICMSTPDKINTKELVDAATFLSKTDKIDDVINLRNSKFYLFNSNADKVVNPEALIKTEEFLTFFTDKKNIFSESHPTAAHGFLTLQTGNTCEQQGIPWLQKCNYDQAGTIFNKLYGEATMQSAGKMMAANLFEFSQKQFMSKNSALLDSGYIYIPEPCRQGAPCKLHIAFHGCLMNKELIGNRFALEAGYNSWAQTNRIIVLYPNAARAEGNPFGCWDWFGYSGKDYLEKAAPQMKAIGRMMQAIAGQP